MTMAETAVESSATTQDKSAVACNNNHPLVANHNYRPLTKQRKRKRLSQVLDKLTGGGGGGSGQAAPPDNNNLCHLQVRVP